jgi:predicted nucleic acid-binding Zn ribbon protein
MPIYSYICEGCQNESTYSVSYEDRLDCQTCSFCGVEKAAHYQMSAPMIGTGRIRGDKRLIRSEKQIEADYGKKWRDKGTTGKEGGAGAQGKVYFS